MGSKSTVKRMYAVSTPGAAGATALIFGPEPIGAYESFDITVCCSSSSGFNYSVSTSPVEDDKYFLSQTGGVFTAGTCATIRHQFPINNEMFIQIKASATAVVSASNITILLSHIDRS